MALSNLLENQTIIIDNHHRGKAIAWERALHIHKRMNNGSKSYIECEIYFADNQGIKFGRKSGKETEKLQNEIYEAFQDPIIRQRFIESFYETIKPILNCDRRSEHDMARVARRAAGRIAKALGLSAYIVSEFEEAADSFYICELRQNRFIAIDYDRGRILAGDNKTSLKESRNVGYHDFLNDI